MIAVMFAIQSVCQYLGTMKSVVCFVAVKV